MAYVTVRIKDVDGHSTEVLEGDRVVVGRSSSAGLTIKHDSISREHCVFVKDGDNWFLEDLGSANGTRLNREKIEGRTALGERDIIRIGKARLTFHAGNKPRKDPTVGPGSGAAIELEAGADVPTVEASPGDPPEAMTCSHCGAWFSTAHRLPGDKMYCPRCERSNIIPKPALVPTGDAGDDT
jgi:predicted component of type VI protein secretion system